MSNPRFAKNDGTYIPVPTGQVIEIPIASLDVFNEAVNTALASVYLSNFATENEATEMSIEELSPGDYKCGLCGGVFTNNPEWTEADKVSEMQQYFGDVPPDERASVCDECWMKIHPERN